MAYIIATTVILITRFKCTCTHAYRGEGETKRDRDRDDRDRQTDRGQRQRNTQRWKFCIYSQALVGQISKQSQKFICQGFGRSRQL